MAEHKHIVIVGGGAAGFYAAIAAAEGLQAGVLAGTGAGGTVTLYEATAHLLAKVKNFRWRSMQRYARLF